MRITRFLPSFCLFLLLLTALACGKKQKKSMSGDENVSLQDFVSFFDEIKLPYGFGDTLLQKKPRDSSLISQRIFNQFIGDSIFTTLYKKEKPTIHAMGAFRNKEEETYLLLRTGGNTKAVWIVALDKDLKPAAHLLLMASRGKASEINRVGIDSKYTISLTDDYRKPDGSLAAYSAVYAYNTAGLFMEIMNDGLRRGEEMEIINPIDTLPMRFAFSGDYGGDARNFISIRDGDSAKSFLFFINMDKANDCIAELKGEARWVKRDSAVFQATGDVCGIGFTFRGSNIRITELEGCGSRRPADCSFNASYSKKSRKKKTKS
jgi:hypothetical protein